MEDPTMLFIGKLPPSCKDAEAQLNLRKLFEKYGEVTEFIFNGTHAFLHMATERQCKDAITYLNGHKIGSALILVAKATGSTAAAGRKLAEENAKKLAQENAKKEANKALKEKEKSSFQSESNASGFHNQSSQNNGSRQQADRFTPYKPPNTSDKYNQGNIQSYQNRDTKQEVAYAHSRGVSPSQSSQFMSVNNDIKKNSTVSPAAVSMSDNPITSHVLDTASGKPAANLKMCLYRMFAGQWVEVSKKTTNSDGRASSFLKQAEFTAGTYKMFFDTEDYFKQQSSKGFYPYVEIVFTIEHPEQHYHIPLLLSPYGYTTYRGS